MPGIVVTFAVAAIAGMAVTDITFSGISNLASDTSQNTDAEWVENNLADNILEKCNQNNIQDPMPLNSNFSHSFDSIKNITAGFELVRSGHYSGYRTIVGLEYNNGQRKTATIEPFGGSPAWTRSCETFKVNGTRDDGSKINRKNLIQLNSKDLNLRIFESSDATAGDGNITLQVRQD